MKSNRFARYASPLYNAMRYPSNYQYQDNHYPPSLEQEEAEPETFYVKMDVDSNEDADLDTETKYVNVMIDTKPRVSRLCFYYKNIFLFLVILGLISI